MATPRLPGGVGVTHLRVYDSVGPDGLAGGTPHLHTACTEAYLVIAGSGAVQTLSAKGAEEVPLAPGDAVWFSPGTVHRLVNDGDLELFVVMSNQGLPEAGDMVITFDDAVLADPDAYRRAATLPPGETTDAGTGVAARERRDAAVKGYLGWREAVRSEGAEALDRLHRRAAALVRSSAGGWSNVVEEGPGAATRQALAWVEDLVSGGIAGMADAALEARRPPSSGRRMGCCGTLGVVVDR